MSSAASEAFRKCSADLIKVIQDQDLLVLAWELYSAGVVSNTVVEGMNTAGLSPVGKKTKLFSAVGSQIDADPAKFQSFLRSLRKQPPLKEVADKLEDNYKECALQPATTNSSLADPNQLLSQAHSATYARQESSKAADFARENRQAITAKFADFQTKVCEKLLKKGINIKTFRLFVINQFPPGDCIPLLPTDLTEIFEVITRHGLWDCFHYSPLVQIIQTFAANDIEMKGWVQSYEKDLKAYRIVTTVEEYIDSDLDSTDPHPDLDTADGPPANRAKHDPRYHTPVEWKTKFVDHSLQYLAEVWKLFSGRYLVPDSPPTALLSRVRKGCFAVTWLIPTGLILSLNERIKIDTDFFLRHRILRVTVGDQCVYAPKKRISVPAVVAHGHQMVKTESKVRHQSHVSNSQIQDKNAARQEIQRLKQASQEKERQITKLNQQLQELQKKNQQLQKNQQLLSLNQQMSADEQISAMTQHAQGQFGYRKIKLIKTKPLGRGSYGAVYKVTCDDLPCAGKVLHPTLFQSNDPGTMTVMERFQQECKFLSAIRHPNIVQYLGSYQDPETQLPVLLMELMDDNLTRFLEQSQQPLPYHIQVDICHDVALALAYLHSNDIIHRDLSSNNVLLMGARNRAKVTDFGMAKLLGVNSDTMTKCPGTQPYMSPEALDDPPVYTKKLDSFSFGVLDIQIITRQFPEPGPGTKKVSDPQSPTGKKYVPILEIERRKSQTDSIDPNHPLLPIAFDCLSYNEKDRPSAQKLCHQLGTLKESPQYGDSVQQAQERSKPAQSASEDKKRHITELQEEIKQLQQATQEKDHVIEARERQLQELNQQLAASEQMTAQLQQSEKIIQELQVQNQHFQKENKRLEQELGAMQPPIVMPKMKLKLSWKTCNEAPCTMHRGSATVCGKIAYFAPDDSSQIHSYNSDTEEWSILPECPRVNFSLTVVNGFVTAVGGCKLRRNKGKNTLLSLVDNCGRKSWAVYFPAMKTKRKYAAVVCSGKCLVVAGGEGKEGELDTVEVMNTDTRKWSTASDLPHSISKATATVSGDRMYLVGAYDQGGSTVFTCSLSLPEKCLKWEKIAALPVFRSTCVILSGQLLAVGGCHSDMDAINNIYSYNTETNSWKEVMDHMPTARYQCLVAVLPGNKLMVVGGATCVTDTEDKDTKNVEVATVQ